MSSRKSVTIIGAGITGPSAALYLARAGYVTVVLEAREESELHSNGLIGVTDRNWTELQKAGADFTRSALNGRMYREIGKGTSRIPFHLISWTDLHSAICDAAVRAGAHFGYGLGRIEPNHASGDYVIDAGGVVSAARRHLHNEFLGSYIYRGTSPVNVREAFTTYKLPGKRGFFDVGYTHTGSAWAFGIRRPAPQHHGTTFTNTPPPEISELPARYQRIIEATPQIMALPQYHWTPPPVCYDREWRHFTLGDANGAVRALTTSGANLGIQAGRMSPALLDGSQWVAASIIARRGYALDLGIRLRGPEIGGYLEDPNFADNQRALYGNW